MSFLFSSSMGSKPAITANRTPRNMNNSTPSSRRIVQLPTPPVTIESNALGDILDSSEVSSRVPIYPNSSYDYTAFCALFIIITMAYIMSKIL